MAIINSTFTTHFTKTQVELYKFLVPLREENKQTQLRIWCMRCRIVWIRIGKKKGKGYGIRLYSPYRRCWSPFLGPSARKCNGGLGASHPVLSHTLPVYLPLISPGTHLELDRLWLSLQSHATDPRPKLKNWVHRDSNPRPLRQEIPNPAHQPTRPGRPRWFE